MPPDPEDTRAYFSAVWGSDLPADAFVTELTTDRGAAETSARRIRASLASLRDRDRTYHGLSERDAFEQKLLLAELDGLERRFGDSIAAPISGFLGGPAVSDDFPFSFFSNFPSVTVVRVTGMLPVCASVHSGDLSLSKEGRGSLRKVGSR